jgi:hypothetical protein
MRACTAAGRPGRILHDFRRIAVRKLERRGVSRTAAMALIGHQTESGHAARGGSRRDKPKTSPGRLIGLRRRDHRTVLSYFC